MSKEKLSMDALQYRLDVELSLKNILTEQFEKAKSELTECTSRIKGYEERINLLKIEAQAKPVKLKNTKADRELLGSIVNNGSLVFATFSYEKDNHRDYGFIRKISGDICYGINVFGLNMTPIKINNITLHDEIQDKNFNVFFIKDTAGGEYVITINAKSREYAIEKFSLFFPYFHITRCVERQELNTMVVTLKNELKKTNEQ